MTKKNRSYFKALLKLEDGEILADGDAVVNITEKSVTFKSSFVPLYPIGTPMEIVRLHDGKEIHRFKGKVYLSDKKLMRIVSVDDELLPGSEDLYCKNMNFPATVAAFFSTDVGEKTFFKRYMKEKQEYKVLDVRIMEMTDEYLVFQLKNSDTEDEPFPENEETDYFEQDTRLFDLGIDEGHQLTINSQTILLPLKEATIEVIEPFYFGSSPSFKCKYVDMTAEEAKALIGFLWEYNMMRNKLF